MYVPQNPPIKTHYIWCNGLISYCFWLQVIWLLCQVLQKLSWFHVIKINIKYVLALQNPLTRMLCIGHPVLIGCFLSASTKSILESYMIVMPGAQETILVWLLIFLCWFVLHYNPLLFYLLCLFCCFYINIFIYISRLFLFSIFWFSREWFLI